MPQQQELQDQTNRTLPVTRGSAELLIFVHQWDSPHLDTPSSDHQEEALPEEEVEEDSLEEVIQAEAVASQEDQEDLPPILWEGIKETD